MVEYKVDRKIDICGEVCPYTFMKSKLALEELGSGQVLEVATDHAPAIEEIASGMKSEGHKVLEVTKIDETTWKIVIQKS